MTGTQYDPIVQRYRRRMWMVMKRLQLALRAQHFRVSKVTESYADTFTFDMAVWLTTKDRTSERNVYIQFKIEDREDHERNRGDDESIALNFAVDIDHVGGRIIGGLTPYQYTPQCWVDAANDDEVEERFEIIERAPVQDFVDLILEATHRRRAA
jgi:hypothetical protein